MTQYQSCIFLEGTFHEFSIWELVCEGMHFFSSIFCLNNLQIRYDWNTDWRHMEQVKNGSPLVHWHFMQNYRNSFLFLVADFGYCIIFLFWPRFELPQWKFRILKEQNWFWENHTACWIIGFSGHLFQIAYWILRLLSILTLVHDREGDYSKFEQNQLLQNRTKCWNRNFL